MNHNVKATDIEARLHRSLANQVRAPRLDRRFDAGVWARIEAQEQEAARPLAAPVRSRQSGVERWLQVSNIVGIAVAFVLVLIFGSRMLEGADFGGSLASISVTPSREMTDLIAWSVSGAAVVMGAMFTPLGRWLRTELIRFGL